MLALLFLGALYQGLALRQFADNPWFGNPVLDARYQVEWAFALADGQDPHSLWFQSPLYSYMLAGMIRTVGWSVPVIVGLQVLLGLGAALLLERTLVLLQVPRPVRLALFAFMLLDPLLPFYAAFTHKTSLEIFLTAAVLWSGVRLAAAGGWPVAAALLFGFTCGAAALVRSTFQAVVGLPVLLARGRRLAVLGAALAGAAPALLWGVAHNSLAAGELLPIQTSLGFNLYVGNNPGNPLGEQVLPPELSVVPLEEEGSARTWAESRQGRSLRPSEVDAVFRTEVLRYLREQPDRFLATLGRKVVNYLHRQELADNERYSFLAPAAPLMWRNPLGWGLVMLAVFPALGWIAAGWARRRSVPPAEAFAVLLAFFLAATLVVFFSNSRLRVGHLTPWLAVVGIGLRYLAGMWSTWRGHALALGAVLLVPGIALAVLPVPGYHPDEAWTKTALIYHDLQDFARAREAAERIEEPELRQSVLDRIAESVREPDGFRPELLSPVVPRWIPRELEEGRGATLFPLRGCLLSEGSRRSRTPRWSGSWRSGRPSPRG